MAIAWCVAPIRRRPNILAGDGITIQRVIRYCAVDDYSQLILADGGWWAYAEVLGQQCIAKVRASVATLQTIQADPDIIGVSHNRLDEPLSDLTSVQKTAILNRSLLMGYTLAEMNAASGGDWGSKTLGDLLRFWAQRALRHRYDAITDTVIADGAQFVPTRPEYIAGQV